MAALCFCTTVKAGSESTSGASPPQESAIEKRYTGEIERLKREVKTAKAHRMALATKMDQIRQTLLDLKSKETLESDKKPSIEHGIASNNRELTDHKILLNAKRVQLEALKKKVHLHQAPSLFEDALGSANALLSHRQLALQKYFIHKTSLEVQRYEDKQQLLTKQQKALTKASRTLQSKLGLYHTDSNELTDRRKTLEQQFTEISTVIVQQQDRVEQLKQRWHNVRKDPKMAAFAFHRGNLPDPTEGILKHRYAEPKARGLLHWDGVVISAPLGQQIAAVFDGEVVFADHMRRLGNVAIIDHGEGYMSLYGMADFLVVEPGQHVLGGDTIGTVGSSNAMDESTLYFEIRHNAHTVDPEEWLELSRISQDSKANNAFSTQNDTLTE